MPLVWPMAPTPHRATSDHVTCARKPELSTGNNRTGTNGCTHAERRNAITRQTRAARAASRRGAAAPAVSDRRGVRCALLFISSDRRVDRRYLHLASYSLSSIRHGQRRDVRCTRSGRCGCTPGTCPRDLSSYVVGTFTTSQPGTVLSRVSSALASAPTALASAMASWSKPSSSIMSLRSLASACPSSSCR